MRKLLTQCVLVEVHVNNMHITSTLPHSKRSPRKIPQKSGPPESPENAPPQACSHKQAVCAIRGLLTLNNALPELKHVALS